MYGTLRSSKVLEILQIIKHINYSNLSASPSSDLLWRRLYGDRHEIIFFQYDPTTKSAKQNNLHISMEPTAPEHE